MHYVCGYRHMFFSERLYTFVHLYVTVPGLYRKRERFLLHKMDYILDIFLQNGHCGPVFYCVAYKCIWLSYKCIYIKVHLMRLMKLCHHIRAPRSSLVIIIIIIIGIIIIIITTVPASSLSPSPHSLPFLPLELLSLSNSTDAHT